MMSVQERIEARIRETLAPDHLEIVNESGMHAVPAGSESHFRLLVVSREFAGRSQVERHRAVYQVLAEEMAGPIHALGLQTLSPDEWNEDVRRSESPECLGGSKAADG